jgi:hypothetical protein
MYHVAAYAAANTSSALAEGLGRMFIRHTGLR